MMRAIVALLWLACASPAMAEGATTIVGRASVIDGDTIEIQGQRIRLHGIDAPESRQECGPPERKAWRCGQQASLALPDRVGTATIRCEPNGHDRYRRIIAVCFRRREDLNRWMVAAGWAVAFRRYSNDYVSDEEQARVARRGIWRGSFMLPAEWRKQHPHGQ